MSKVVGILGGMGPMSTVDLMRMITERTPARWEREHLRILVDSRPQIPDRPAGLFGTGPSPAPMMVESAQLLERWGAEFIAIPCNTAHGFLDEVQESVKVEVLDMIGLVGRELTRTLDEGSPVGLLATTAAGKAGVFHRRIPGFSLVTPPEDQQEELVTSAILQIKAEHGTDEPRRLLLAAAEAMDPRPQALIAGCTEVELALAGTKTPVPLFLPMRLLAEEIVRKAWKQD